MNRLSEWAIVFRNQLPESLPVFVILQKHCFTFATGPPGLRKGAVFRRRVRALFRHKHVYKSRRWRHVRHWLHKALRERMWWVFLLFVFFHVSDSAATAISVLSKLLTLYVVCVRRRNPPNTAVSCDAGHCRKSNERVLALPAIMSLRLVNPSTEHFWFGFCVVFPVSDVAQITLDIFAAEKLCNCILSTNF